MSRFIKNNGANWNGFGTDKFEESEKLVQENNTCVIPPGCYDEDDKPKRKTITKAKAIEMLKDRGLDETVTELSDNGWSSTEINAITNVMMDEFAYAADGLATYGQMDTEDWALK